MDITVIIMAAGKGKRMKSSLPKVLHQLANASFLEIILSILHKLKVSDIRIVTSNDLQEHRDFKALATKFKFSTHLQKERLGTANAVSCALKSKDKKPILILNGDCPLIKGKTLQNIYATFTKNSLDVLCVGFKTKSPKGYGRLITFGEDLIEIVEEKDLRKDQTDIRFCNAGTYMLNAKHAIKLLSKITSNNIAKEFYLTDIVKHAVSDGLRVSFIKANEFEVFGINDCKQKAKAEFLMQVRLRKSALNRGITLISPETVFLSYDTQFESNIKLHPFVTIGPNVNIKQNSEIFSFTQIDNSQIGKQCKIGPYARLRNNNIINDDVKIGNFVEVKASSIGVASKASHLTYIGDATIGKRVNIGAGTIFCNFDGYNKHQSKVGNNVFIGSNVALVAPISIGNNAKIGAGSVITENIMDNYLAIARARQSNFLQKKGINKKVKD